jgi:hypothetical protein
MWSCGNALDCIKAVACVDVINGHDREDGAVVDMMQLTKLGQRVLLVVLDLASGNKLVSVQRDTFTWYIYLRCRCVIPKVVMVQEFHHCKCVSNRSRLFLRQSPQW